MPLKKDAEYESEVLGLSTRTRRQNRVVWWLRLLIYAGILWGTLFLLMASGVSNGLMISAVVALSALCIIAALHSAAYTIHESLTIIAAVTEWVGRKQLGEYEPPQL